MKKKSLLIFSLLFLSASAFLFAMAEQEYPGPSYGWAYPNEEVTVTGKVYFFNRLYPEIESGGKKYELLVPRHVYYGINIEEGKEITVKGYVVPPPRFEPIEENEIYLAVTEAEIDGRRYNLERYGYGIPWRSGPGYGPRWRGPGYWPNGYGPRGRYGPAGCWW